MTRPTVSQAEAWRPDSLRAAADAWDAASTDINREFGVIVRGVQDTEDFWTGDSAAAARERAAEAAADADELARSLVAASAAARTGADRISAAHHEVLSLVGFIRILGFTVADDGTVTPPGQAATELTRQVIDTLEALGAADAEAARDIEAAFHPVSSDAPTVPAMTEVNPADWPKMSQDSIASHVARLTPEQRQKLIEDYPQQVGNTDGVPWDMRTAANRINIAQAIVDERRNLARPVDEKLREIIRGQFPGWSPGESKNEFAEMWWSTLQADPGMRSTAIALYDRQFQDRISFYEGLLGQVADPTGRVGLVDRQVLAFDPGRASFIELLGDMDTAKHIGVLVPGMSTTIDGSAVNTETATRFVREGHGDLAMITYLGGPFPPGIHEAAGSHHALDMAPRLVAFSEDVNRVADAKDNDIPVTYVGHSYGGSILGTAESMGLTADRTLYVEAAGAGVGVGVPGDWHNTNPNVERFSMTAPLDPIELIQGRSAHGADPDEMSGVTRLGTGYYDSGGRVIGADAHSGVLNESSDAWRNIYSVMTYQPYSEWPWTTEARILTPLAPLLRWWN